MSLLVPPSYYGGDKPGRPSAPWWFIDMLVLVLLFCVVTLSGCSRATAAPELPSKMPLDQAIKLDRDLTKAAQGEMLKAQIEREVAPYKKEAGEILDANKINRADFGKTVAVNFSTGEIQRAAPGPVPK